MKPTVIILLAAACVAPAADRSWTDAAVTSIERKQNWGMDRHATLYHLRIGGEVVVVADIPQMVGSGAPAPRAAIGDQLAVEQPKNKWGSRVRVRFLDKVRRLYLDSVRPAP